MALVVAAPTAMDAANAIVDAAPDVLPFQREIVRELVQRDGVCVLAEGLGASVIVAALVAIDADANARERRQGKTALNTVIVGATDEMKVSVKERLRALFPSATSETPLEFTADVHGDARRKRYDAGCVAFVTTRIASVDLLSGRLDPKRVRGVIVCGAHRTTETSGEGFVVRLFREGNRNGYVRAISDRPGNLTRGLTALSGA
jgi:DNA excision repair protein ERCC-4